MANPQRIGLAGGLNHVTARGDRCEAICFDEADRLTWLKLLGDLREVPRLQRRGGRHVRWPTMRGHRMETRSWSPPTDRNYGDTLSIGITVTTRQLH